MQDLRVVWWKEIKALLSPRALVVELILLTVLAGAVLPVLLISKIPSRPIALLVIAAVYPFISLFVLLFSTFSWISKVFIAEKVQRTLEMLLTTPLDLRTIWIGKTLAIFSGAYARMLVALTLFTVGTHIVSLIQGHTLGLLFPPLLVVLRSLVIFPLFVLGFIGFSGLAIFMAADVGSANMLITIVLILAFTFLLPKTLQAQASGLWVAGESVIAVVWVGGCIAGTKLLKNERVVLGKS